jgi:signal transduction histidine kinase
MRILVADDEATSRLIAETALRGLGHECEVVSDGVQALAAFRSGRPDVVISDWMMPGLSGLELCRTIRAEPAGATTYFIMVTNQGTRDQIVEGVEAGADDYLLKPLDPEDLQTRLIAAARVTSLHRTMARQQTELEALNSQLAETNEELRDLDRLKDEFVALVSHELRTPLTSIIGYVSALTRGRAGIVPTKQLEVLTIVDRNAQRLSRLVNDLLMAAQADAGELQLEAEPLELGTVVRQSVESARSRADDQRVLLMFSGADGTRVVADHGRLLQVFDNLVSNAIKFSPAGGTVDVRVSSEGGLAVIEVRDEGIGIPLAEQQLLFGRFFRASTATSREIQGTGLGLSIVKKIVELHQGTIEVSSREGVGTTFMVNLPLALSEEVA